MATIGAGGCGKAADPREAQAANEALHARVDAVLTQVKGLVESHERLKVEVAGRGEPAPVPAETTEPVEEKLSAAALVEQLEEMDQRLSAIEDRVGSQLVDIESRVEALAAVADIEQASVGGTPSDPAADGDSQHVMSIESVEELPRDATALDEASTLRREAKQLADRLKELEGRRDELLKRPYPYWWYWESHREERRREELDRRRQRESLSKQIADVRGDLRRREGAAKAKEKIGETPRQRVTGWDGTRTVILETTKDLSPIIVRAQREGKLLGWRGKLVDSDDEAHRWQVGHLSVEEKPKDFRPRR